MDKLIVYSLTLYFWYHLVMEADLTRKGREWVLPRIRGWVKDLLECPFCTSFHIGWLICAYRSLRSGRLTLDPVIVFCAPVLILAISRALAGPETR